MKRLDNKVCLITGAAQGIGLATARKFAAEGAQVLLCDLNPDAVAQAVRDCEGLGLPAIGEVMNVTDRPQVDRVVAQALERFGRVDVLVNNAGITRDGAFKRMTPEQWFEVIQTNLCSLYNVTQPLFDAMCEQRDARIINISSVNGQKGQFGQVNYSAAKAGMLGFTKALAAEGARFGVTVNAIAPGYTATPMVEAIRSDILDSIKADIPMHRLAKPEEIAAAVAFLASEAGAYITGETLSINGGLYMK